MDFRLVTYVAILLFLTGSAAFAQEQDLESILRFEFEGTEKGETLRGWGGGPAVTIHFDSTIVHGGSGAARLERDADSPMGGSIIMKQIEIDFSGQWIELRGFLRTEGVNRPAGLWMRQDGPSGQLQFINMWGQGLLGTTGWTEYTIRLPLDENARDLIFGVLVSGEGTIWADDLRLLVDGKPIQQAK